MNELITTGSARDEDRQVRFCRECGCACGASDNYCGQCGTGCRPVTTVSSSAPPVAVGQFDSSVTVRDDGFNLYHGENALARVLNHRWCVVGIVALAGPLGLLALWFSPRFSRATKVIVTTIYGLLTVVVPLAIAWYWLDYAVRPVLNGLN